MVRTLFGLLLLAGLIEAIFVSSSASVRAASTPHSPTSTKAPKPSKTPKPTPTPTLTPTLKPTATPSPTPNVTPCPANTTYNTHSLVINEVGWAGTEASPADQWIELYNPGSCQIDLGGWELDGVNYYYTEGVFTIPLTGIIPGGAYFLLLANDGVFENIGSVSPYYEVDPDPTNNPLNLSNYYQSLELFSPSGIIDTANIATNENWPAGNTTNYASMERYYPPGGTIPADGAAAWVTFAGPTTDTALDRKGKHVYGTPGMANWASTVTETPSPFPTATKKPTPSPAPTPVPAVVINEILPRPGSDWNGDGAVNNADEFIEVENLGPGVATLTHWTLKVVPNNGAGSYILPSLKLNPNGRAFFFGSTTHLLLEDSGDTVSLIDTHGVIEDAFTYPAVIQPDDSWCRIRDGIGFWRDGCFPTPGFENALSGILPTPPPPGPGGAAACLLPDVAPDAFRLAECSGPGGDIWNQQYWNDLAGQEEYAVPDPNSKGQTYIQ
ncbi:MAG TPA: lamin tail domain-containing protein [Anaerolineales bacterium]|nr:lamin tail domain-containing protein [Anaerolineales bacterium]